MYLKKSWDKGRDVYLLPWLRFYVDYMDFESTGLVGLPHCLGLAAGISSVIDVIMCSSLP